MDGNEGKLEFNNANTEAEQSANKTTSELQDFSLKSAADTSGNNSKTVKHDFEGCVEEFGKSIGSVGGKRRGCFSISSETSIHKKLKFDYLVSRPFLRTSASASGLSWSRQQLNDGLKFVFRPTGSNPKHIPTISGAVDRSSNVAAKSSTDSVWPFESSAFSEDYIEQEEILIRELGSDVVLSGCPTYFYALDAASLKSTSDEDLDSKLCRICYMSDKQESFIEPPACSCAGTMQYCHQSCLANWVAQSGNKKCELCGYRFRMRTLNMFRVSNWTCIPMTTLDKLYICLFLLASGFILTTGIYVCWAMLSSSPSATLERESTAAQVLFPVYTGFDLFCLSIIMYVLKGRINQMWRKWRAHNRSIIILSRLTEQEV